MRIHTNRENSSVPKRLRPGEEQIQAHIESSLQEVGIRNPGYGQDLLSMWQEAIDMGCSQELAREKLDEALRGVMTYLRLNLAVIERRRMINALFDHMSKEIKMHVRDTQGEIDAPLSPEERRELERQHRRDDDPRAQRRADEARGQHERKMRQHRVNSAGNTTMGVQDVY